MNNFWFLNWIVLIILISLQLLHQKSCFYLRSFKHLQIIDRQYCVDVFVLCLVCFKKWLFLFNCLLHYQFIFLSLNWINFVFFNKSRAKWIEWLLLNRKLFLVVLQVIKFNILVMSRSRRRDIIIFINFSL